MGIRPALGWLALLLFTTAAHAERGGAKDGGAFVAPVTPKTKAPGVILASAKVAPSAIVLVSAGKPQANYEAEIYSGVPLDGELAKGRGFDKGLVLMVFGRERRATYRVPMERIRRIVRLSAEEPLALASQTSPPKPAAAKPARERWDVLDTDDGVVVVATTTTNAGIFTTSDVYLFPRGANLDRRVAMLDALPPASRGRVREVLLVAERSLSGRGA
jgi:hypothetical protein